MFEDSLCSDIPKLESILDLVAAREKRPIVFSDINSISTNLRAMNSHGGLATPDVPPVDHAVPPATPDYVAVRGVELDCEYPVGVASLAQVLQNR